MNLTELSQALQTIRSNIETGATASAISQISTLIVNVEVEQAAINEELRRAKEAEANRFSYRPEQSIIDIDIIKMVDFTPGPIRITLGVTHQTRYNGLSSDFTVFLPGRSDARHKEGDLDIINDDVREAWEDNFSDHFCGDNADDIPSWWMLIGLLGTNPHPELLNMFRNGLILITDMPDEMATKVFNNWAEFVAAPYLGFDVEVEEDNVSS